MHYFLVLLDKNKRQIWPTNKKTHVAIKKFAGKIKIKIYISLSSKPNKTLKKTLKLLLFFAVSTKFNANTPGHTLLHTYTQAHTHTNALKASGIRENGARHQRKRVIGYLKGKLTLDLEERRRAGVLVVVPWGPLAAFSARPDTYNT